MADDGDADLQRVPMPLDRDRFMRALIRQLSGSLEDVIGLEEAKGYFSLVGSVIGTEIGRNYREALQAERLDRPQVAAVLVDLKRRIEGDFYIISQDDEKIVLGNRACPFGDQVNGRTSMCMMTSNVFGAITASNLGYAKVELQETIARGHPGCRVVVWLRPDGAAAAADGREYFPVLDMQPESG
jgi:predicted ArsR family transcriptional regulator